MSDLNAKSSSASASTPPKKKAGRIHLGPVRTVILIVLIAALIVSSYLFFDSYRQYKDGDNLYTSLGNEFMTFPSSTPPLNTPTPVPTAPVPSDDPGEIIDEPPEDPLESPEPTQSYVENYAPDIWPDIDWDGLRAVNSDTAAWLLCVGTNINYPVVYSKDNVDYLNTMFNGGKSKVGTLFVDARNSTGFTDRNTIIYGHNMRNHSMFWTLTQYKSQSFYNNHTTMRLILPEGKYELQLFAGIVIAANETDTFWRVDFDSDEEFLEWVDTMKSHSTFTSYVDVAATDRVVTMSTCTYEFNNARYIVLGKLVEVS